MRKNVTIYDVARRAGVSHMTVSRVLNETPGTGLTSEPTRQKVLKAIDELGYKPNSGARALALSRTNTIAVALYDVDYLLRSCFSSVLIGVIHRIAVEGYNLQLVSTAPKNARKGHEIYFLDPIRDRRVDGLIVIDHQVSDEKILEVHEHGIPCVLVDRQVDSSGPVYTVGINNRRGMLLATQHLMDLGHEQIGCVVGPMSFDRDREMVAGYKLALEERGLEYDPSLIWSLESKPAETLETYINKFPLPTGFVTSTDDNAAFLIAALMRRNIRVPEDVSVVGYGGGWAHLAISQFVPDITAVRTPLREVGELAVELIVEAAENGRPAASLILREPELQMGSSTMLPPDLRDGANNDNGVQKPAGSNV